MLRIEGVRRAFDGDPVLRGVDLRVESGEIVCLLGPSGSGKTTLLRIVAGLEALDTGALFLNNAPFADVPVHERDFGLMFQDFALFPHMTVAENIRFGLKMKRTPAAEKAERVREVLAWVGLDDFADRDVTQLSGGERQRVALARSLAPRPRLLMLDEPLGSLDAALRDRLVVELRQIIKRAGLTALYVTHDQQEAFAVADRIAVMNRGQIEQVDTPQALYQQPDTDFVANFLGLSNIIPVEKLENNTMLTPLGRFPGTGQQILLHPDGITLDLNAEGYEISGQLVERVFQGASYRLKIAHESGHMLTFSVPARKEFHIVEGATLTCRVNQDAVMTLRATDDI